MAERLSLETALARADCDDRLRARIDPRRIRPSPDPARPVVGRSSIDGFDIRLVLGSVGNPVLRARGRYRLSPTGGTAVDLELEPVWAQLLWILPMSALFALLMVGFIDLMPRRGSGEALGLGWEYLIGPFLGAFAFLALIQLAVWAVFIRRYVPRDRVRLRAFLEETLDAREAAS